MQLLPIADGAPAQEEDESEVVDQIEQNLVLNARTSVIHKADGSGARTRCGWTFGEFGIKNFVNSGQQHTRCCNCCPSMARSDGHDDDESSLSDASSNTL